MSIEDERLQKFLGDGNCLIVEPSSAFSSSLQKCLKDMGIPLSRVQTSRKFEDAKRLIAEKKPKLLVTEYEIEQSFGLALIEMQEQYHGEMSRISAIVTKNNSDSAVAEAAEEQVDLYILKPFSVDTFKQKMNAAIHRKVSPSPYAQKVQAGKRFLEAKEFEGAIQEFFQAKPLQEKPTLACFYAGQTFHAQGNKAAALAEFQAGRRHQALHYKCLIGEFEMLVEERRFKEAYALVPLIRDNYPLTSHRLGQIFIAAVFTYNFDDLRLYYNLFLKLEQRPPQLIKLTSMALLTAGRFALKEKDIRKASVFYEMGIITTGRNIEFIEAVVSDLLKIKASNEAEAFLAKVAQSDVGTSRFKQLAFRVDEQTLRKDQVIEKGRKLVIAGEGNPEIFQSLVRLMAEEGKITMAETVISTAVAKHPELRDALYKILEESKPPAKPAE